MKEPGIKEQALKYVTTGDQIPAFASFSIMRACIGNKEICKDKTFATQEGAGVFECTAPPNVHLSWF